MLGDWNFDGCGDVCLSMGSEPSGRGDHIARVFDAMLMEFAELRQRLVADADARLLRARAALQRSGSLQRRGWRCLRRSSATRTSSGCQRRFRVRRCVPGRSVGTAGRAERTRGNMARH